jgi:hypothetical protein
MRPGGALSMDNAAPPQPDALPAAKVPEDMQAAPPVEQIEQALGTPEMMRMAVPTETLTLTLVEQETEKVLASPTADAAASNVAEPSPTLPPGPTWTPTKSGHPAEETLTKSTPTETATTAPSPTPLAPHTATLEPTHTTVPTATSTDTPTAAPAAPPTRTPAPEPGQVSRVQATPEQAPGEGVAAGLGEEDAPPSADRGPWQGWRIAQIGLGVVLVGLLVAILWLRRWGRLG